MKNIAYIAAQMLEEGRRPIADLVCSHVEFSTAKGDPSPPSVLLAKRSEQTETHIQILATCIKFSSPLLLADYVRWINVLPEKVSPFDCDISTFLNELVRVVEAQFPGDVTQVIKAYIHQALNASQKDGRAEPVARETNPHDALQRRYMAALLATRRSQALRLVLAAIDSGVDMESIYLNVIQPSQQELGRLWQAGEISVAQEHYCTASTQFVMSQLQPYFLTDNSSETTLIATCVGDELHEVGLRIVADLFEVSGWNTIYLGANTPAESISETIADNKAQVLAISTTMTQHLAELANVIKVARSHPGCQQVQVLVGGYPFNIDPFLWKRVGADAYASDGRDAIRVANRLLNSQPSPVDVVRAPTPKVVEESVPSTSLETYDDLSRLNNKLITLQRKLNKANVELAAANKKNQEKADALQRADRRKDEFLAMLAHELRGPLAPMELAVGLLRMENLHASVVQEAHDTMKRQF